MATLSEAGIKAVGTGILLPYTIPGEPPESYKRRCELDKIRNCNYNEPNEAEIEYKKIWNYWSAKYWKAKHDKENLDFAEIEYRYSVYLSAKWKAEHDKENQNANQIDFHSFGSVAERLIAPALKTGEPEGVPWVRILPLPPDIGQTDRCKVSV